MIIHCNRVECQKGFEVDENRADKFYGSAAVRTHNFHTCPHCGWMDSGWFYAIDEMPVFIGSPGKIRRQQDNWAYEN